MNVPAPVAQAPPAVPAAPTPVRLLTPSPVRVLAGLGAVRPGQWDRLVGAGAAGLRHSFLLAWEQAELSGLRGRPIAVTSDGGGVLLAAAPAYHYDMDLVTVSAPVLPGAAHRVRRVWPRFMKARVYELGGPVARHDPLLLAPGANSWRLAREIVGASVREAEAAGSAMIVVQDHVPQGGPLAAALAQSGFDQVKALPSFAVEVRHPSFEAYLDAMRSKYRRRWRCVLRDSRHLRVELVEDFTSLAEEMARLWRLVHDRSTETRREILGAQFFAAAAELESVQALVLRRQDGSIASFGLLLADGGWLHFLQCGFTDRAGRSEGAYFRLLLEIVRLAIEQGFDVAHLGCTTAGPKLDLGAVPVPLTAWLRHRSRLMQKLAVAGGNGPFAPAAVQPRNVFSAGG